MRYHIHSCFIIILPVFIMAWWPCRGNSLRHLPLPPGYAYPKIGWVSLPDPFYDSGFSRQSGVDKAELRLISKNFVGWKHNMDTYSGSVRRGDVDTTWEFLTVEHSYHQIWDPTFAIRLHQATASLLRVVTRKEIILFAKKTDAEGQIYFECENADTWKIYRRDHYVVVEGVDLGRVFMFESIDMGTTWRVAQSYPTARPDLTVSFTYDDQGKPEYLRHPDGALTHFTFEGDALAKVELPNGSVYKFVRDPSQHLAALEEYRPKQVKVKAALEGFTIVGTADGIKQEVAYSKATTRTKLEKVRSWLFENDSTGRATRYVNECQKTFDVVYQEEVNGRKAVYISTITDQRRQQVEWLRHTAIGKSWVYERGSDTVATTQQDWSAEKTTTFKKIGITFRPTRYERRGRNTATLVSYDAVGHPLSRAIEDENGQIVKTWSVDTRSDIIARGSSGLATQRSVKGEVITYSYTDEILDTAENETEKQTFRFDLLGRMIYAESFRDDSGEGLAEAWSYDGYNRVGQVSHYQILSSEHERKVSLEGITIYTYDDWDRIVALTVNGVVFKRFQHGCDGVTACKDSVGRESRFYYNDLGQVRKLVKEEPGSPTLIQRFKYDDKNRLSALQEIEGDGEPIVISYHYGANGHRYVTRTHGPIKPEVLVEKSREIRTGSGESLAYNRYHAVIER